MKKSCEVKKDECLKAEATERKLYKNFNILFCFALYPAFFFFFGLVNFDSFFFDSDSLFSWANKITSAMHCEKKV